MNKVNAPEGFEGCYFFDVNIKEYVVAIKRTNSTWWKNIGYAGHGHQLKEATIERAEKEVVEAVEKVKLGYINL